MRSPNSSCMGNSCFWRDIETVLQQGMTASGVGPVHHPADDHLPEVLASHLLLRGLLEELLLLRSAQVVQQRGGALGVVPHQGLYHRVVDTLQILRHQRSSFTSTSSPQRRQSPRLPASALRRGPPHTLMIFTNAPLLRHR